MATTIDRLHLQLNTELRDEGLKERDDVCNVSVLQYAM
jgi:hypothetical protein